MVARLLPKGGFTALFAIAVTFGAFTHAAKAQSIDGAFANVFELTGGARGNYVTGFGWGDLSLAIANVNGSSVTLQPNGSLYADNPGDSFWRDNGGAGPGGNKWVEMSVFGTQTIPASGSQSTETFTGCALSNTLAAPYSAVAFIRVFSEDFSQLFGEVTAGTGGTFNLSIDITGDVNVQVQKGFQTSGPNANPADLPDLGAVNISIGAPCAASGPGGDGLTKIPVLPIWALALLAGVLGLVGARVAGRHSR
jgi:hypothetical protein